jgi:TetR/AcrR family transcriptional repressor of nem operon
MNELHLTHRSFYRHFGSKEDLFVEAVVRAQEDNGEQMRQVASANPGAELQSIIER